MCCWRVCAEICVLHEVWPAGRPAPGNTGRHTDAEASKATTSCCSWGASTLLLRRILPNPWQRALAALSVYVAFKYIIVAWERVMPRVPSDDGLRVKGYGVSQEHAPACRAARLPTCQGRCGGVRAFTAREPALLACLYPSHISSMLRGLIPALCMPSPPCPVRAPLWGIVYHAQMKCPLPVLSSPAHVQVS